LRAVIVKIIDNVNDDCTDFFSGLSFRIISIQAGILERMKRGAAEGLPGKSWSDVFKELQTGIISGRYRPRERLVEDEIIAGTGATRHSVRKSFDELERVGLVVRQPNRGVQVRDYSLSEIENLYEIRECLEMRAAAHFARPADAELIGKLTDLATQHREASREQRFGDVFTLNNMLHQTIYRAAGNEQLAEAITHYTFMTHPIRTRAFPNEELRQLAVTEHFQMIDAIAAGDGERLAETIRIHIARPKEFYIKTSFAFSSVG
jgi:DNA-binding GntR family transcriptional regulator